MRAAYFFVFVCFQPNKTKGVEKQHLYTNILAMTRDKEITIIHYNQLSLSPKIITRITKMHIHIQSYTLIDTVYEFAIAFANKLCTLYR